MNRLVRTAGASGVAPLSASWQADAIVITRGDELIEQLHADEIERVTLLHADAGESPAEVRAAIFDLRGQVVLLDAASGITGRILFERQSLWSQRNCIYWVSERSVAWPETPTDSRWWPSRHRPQHLRLTPSAAVALFERSELSGPHTWEQRKQYRIERRRLFPGRSFSAASPHLGAAN